MADAVPAVPALGRSGLLRGDGQRHALGHPGQRRSPGPAQRGHLCEAVQEATGETVKLAWADQGYTGEQARQDAQASEIDLQIVKLPEARKGFVLLPRRWVVERSFGWLARFRRLSRDFERLPHVLAALHFLVFVTLMLPKAAPLWAAGESA